MALAPYEKFGATVKQLHTDTRVPISTLKWHLRILVRDEVIKQPYRGRYVYQPGTPDILVDPEAKEGVHGLVLVCTSDLLRMPAWAAKAPEPGVRYTEESMLWLEHLVQFRYYPSTKRLVVYVPSTRNPIPWTQLGHLEGWLSGVLRPLDAGHFIVSQIGINLDHETWRFKGVQAIEYSKWRNATEQLYQKRRALRHEVHLEGEKSLTLERAVQILKEGSAEVKLFRALQVQLKVVQTEAKLAESGQARIVPKVESPADAHESGYG